MDKNNEKKAGESLNEAYLMSVMAGKAQKPEDVEVPKDPAPESKEEPNTEKPSVVKERNRSKKASDLSYSERFLNEHSMTRRGDKSIYIRQEYHERLCRIVLVIAEDRIPLYAYLDNILKHHFALFEKDITEDYNEKNKPIF